MNTPAHTAAPATPIEGLHHFVEAWRAKLLAKETTPQTRRQHFERAFQRVLQPELPQQTKDAFVAVLDAMDLYISSEIAPRYASNPNIRGKLDAYWQTRGNMYDPVGHNLPKTKNGMSVARSYMDMILDHLKIGEDSNAYQAVQSASDAFYKEIYRRDRTSTRSRA